jgi:hypothetical protein
MSNYTYEVKKKSKDFKQATLVKKNVDIEFTLDTMERNAADLVKKKTEIEAQMKLEEAKQGNIEHHHKFVKAMKLSDEQWFTVKMYAESKFIQAQAKAMLPRVKKALKNHEAEKKAIYEQLGFTDEAVN